MGCAHKNPVAANHSSHHPFAMIPSPRELHCMHHDTISNVSNKARGGHKRQPFRQVQVMPGVEEQVEVREVVIGVLKDEDGQY